MKKREKKQGHENFNFIRSNAGCSLRYILLSVVSKVVTAIEKPALVKF
jgi:hypothetical protein